MSYSAAFSQLYVTFTTKSLLSSEKSGLINEINPDNFNISLAGISDPTDSDSDRDGMPDGWEYCYSVYGEFLPVNDYRWSMNPINPLDINYDPDADGWYDRQFNDQPATQGKWENRQFTPLATENQISNGVLGLYFSNLMEYNNGTHPLDADSDDDSMIMEPVITNGEVTSYVQNMNLTDGREVFKYGTNPLDNDTDGDMMPDFYEYYRGWNETNDNWSSYLQIQVQWEQISSNNWKPVQIINGVIARPVLNSVWFTHDATNADDAGQADITNYKYFRVTNLDDTNYLELRVTGTADSFFVKVKAGETFLLMDNEIDAVASGTAIGTLTDITQIGANANTAAIDIEFVVVTA
jgi:hypothetical protein